MLKPKTNSNQLIIQYIKKRFLVVLICFFNSFILKNHQIEIMIYLKNVYD
jgi:hypothetical protein